MEWIKTIYRDLFLWSNQGNSLKKEIKFDNQPSWQEVVFLTENFNAEELVKFLERPIDDAGVAVKQFDKKDKFPEKLNLNVNERHDIVSTALYVINYHANWRSKQIDIKQIFGEYRLIKDANDGTAAQEEDMAKAREIGHSHLWGEMMAGWDCKYVKHLDNVKEIRKQNRGKKEFIKFCEKWKLMAMAADAYVKSWESKNADDYVIIYSSQKDEKDGEFPLECYYMKPQFLVEQGELQISSAMEVMKAVYRDLFGWGTGESQKIGTKLENQIHWEMIAFLIKNLKEEELRELLQKLNDAQTVDDAGVKEFDGWIIIFSCYKINDIQQRRDIVSSALFAKKRLYKATFDEQRISLNKAYRSEDEKYFKEFKNFNDADSLQKNCANFQQLWEYVQELGLDKTCICDASRKYKEDFLASRPSENNLWHIAKVAKESIAKILEIGKAAITDHLAYHTVQQAIGKWYGRLYTEIEIHAGANMDELKQMLPDPCEEAKLKVKKREMDEEDKHDDWKLVD